MIQKVVKKLDSRETQGMSKKEWKEARQKLESLGMKRRSPVRVDGTRVWLK